MEGSNEDEVDIVDDSSGEDVGASDPAHAPVFIYRRDDFFGDENVHQDAGEGLADQWSVPWSDIMMVMFVLFAALLAAKMMNPDIEIRYRAKPVPQIHDVEVEVEKPIPDPVLSRQPSFEPLMRLNVFDQSQEAIREAQLQNIEIVLLDDQSVKVSVQGPMFFEQGRADLLPDVTDFLDSLARVIGRTPYIVHVVGHTDDNPIATGEFPSNWELSTARASRVARYLIQAADLQPSRFIVMGHGQHAPAHSNDDAANRALNRRVEIIITRNLAASSPIEEGENDSL